MRSIELEQLVPIGGQAEEIALLLHPLDRRAGGPAPLAVGADAGLVFGIERFLADRIPAGVFGKIDVAVVCHPLPDRLRSAIVPRFRGADESVVAALEPLDHGAEPRHGALDEFARRKALLGRGLLHLLTVLVGAGQKEHVVAVEPHEARDRIGRDRLVGVADMRRTVRIGDGGGKEIAGLGRHREKALGARVWLDQPRAASASRPNAAKTSGFRSRLNSSTSPAARLSFSHTSATRARRAGLLGSIESRLLSQSRMASRQASNAAASARPSVSPSACMAAGSSAGRRPSSSITRSRTASVRPPSSMIARATLPCAARAASRISASSAERSSAVAAARATSASPSGRSMSRRHRDRMVASRRPGAWLAIRNRARAGGSSSPLSRAFEACGYCSSSAVSTTQTRQPPSPAVEPKKLTVRRTSSTVIP